MTFRRVCSVADVPAGHALRVDTEPVAIAVFNVAGEFYATQDECTHSSWSLADSRIDGDIVECALHRGRFCVRTGKPCGPPATRPLRVFPVRVEGSDVLVDPLAGTLCDEG